MSLTYEIRGLNCLVPHPYQIPISGDLMNELHSQELTLPGLSNGGFRLGKRISVSLSRLRLELEAFLSDYSDAVSGNTIYSFTVEAAGFKNEAHMISGVKVEGKVGMVTSGKDECKLCLGLASRDPTIWEKELDLRNEESLETENMGKIFIVRRTANTLIEIEKFREFMRMLPTAEENIVLEVSLR